MRNKDKWVHIFDMQNIMCTIHELCVAWCKPIDGFLSSFLLSLIFVVLSFYLNLRCVPCVIMCDYSPLPIGHSPPPVGYLPMGHSAVAVCLSAIV